MAESLVDSVLTPEHRARFDVETAEGKGLPNDCYTSEEWLKLENERVFARSWMLAGFQRDIPEPGDACPITVAGLPLLLLRDAGGEVRVFHNVCRHRGAILLDAPRSNLTGLTCPYHSWSYGLDGRLKARPHFFGGGRHDRKPSEDAPGIAAVRHAVWNDLIFVDISGEAVDFEEHWAPFAERTTKYDFNALRHAETLHFDVAGNWKLIWENFYDAYHVPTLHPRLEAFIPINLRKSVEIDGSWFAASAALPELEKGRGLGLPHYPGLDEKTLHSEAYFHLFPSMSIQIWPDQLAVFQLEALAPGRTIEHIHMYFVGDAATDPAYRKERQDVYDMWNELNTEDFEIVENMQIARSSPGFDGGVLSPYWDPPTQHFARLLTVAIR